MGAKENQFPSLDFACT